MNAKFFIVVNVCAALWSSTASAQQQQIMQACRADVQSLCAGVEPGGGRIAACLKENQAKVSAECKAQIQTMMSRKKQQREPRGATAPN
jgi:Cysteine rich repeat